MDRDDKMIVEVLGEPSRISPSDLFEKKFRRSFRGARMADVTAFLEEVGDELERVVDENRRLRTQVRELLAQLEHFRSIETTLRNAMVSTEKFREQVAEESRAEAEQTVADARSEAETMVAEATGEKEHIEQEIESLTVQRERFRQELADLLRSHLELLKSSDPKPKQMTIEADDA